MIELQSGSQAKREPGRRLSCNHQLIRALKLKLRVWGRGRSNGRDLPELCSCPRRLSQCVHVCVCLSECLDVCQEVQNVCERITCVWGL